MPPKKPSELEEQLREQNGSEAPADDVERSSEGMPLPKPKRGDFFGNLTKVAKPD